MALVLENVTAGMSGFVIEVEIGDPAVAIIVGVEFPNYGGPGLGGSTVPPASALATSTAVDFGFIFQPDPAAPPTTIVTLQIRLLSAGITTLRVSNIKKLNDDSGGNIEPLLSPGKITVN